MQHSIGCYKPRCFVVIACWGCCKPCYFGFFPLILTILGVDNHLRLPLSAFSLRLTRLTDDVDCVMMNFFVRHVAADACGSLRFFLCKVSAGGILQVPLRYYCRKFRHAFLICRANKVFQNFPCNSLHLHAFSLQLFYARKNYKERPGAKH